MFKKYISIVILWGLSILCVAYLGSVLLPSASNSNGSSFWPRWANWDGNAYLTISQFGYQISSPSLLVFFPLYPMVIKIISMLTQSPLAAGLLASWVSLLIAGWLLFKLVIQEQGKEVAENSLIALLFFPTAFFFLATYTESLFLVLVLSAFTAIRTRHHNLAIMAAAILSATRLVGIALIPALWYQIWTSSSRLGRKIFETIKTVGALAGITGFFTYLYYLTGKPFFFLEVQSQQFNRNLGLTYPFKVLLSYAKNLVLYPGNRFIGRDSTIIALEFLVSILFLLLTIHVYRKVSRTYAIYAFIAWSIPLMSGMTGSMLRYVIILFPCFISLGMLMTQSRLFKYSYIFISGSLLVLFTINFINGFWIG